MVTSDVVMRPQELTGTNAPAYAQAMAARNLQLLQAIETVLLGLEQDIKQLELMTSSVEDTLGRLQNATDGTPIDPAGAVGRSLEMAADTASRMFTRAKAQHANACQDFRLTSDDGIVDAYGGYLAAIEAFHDAVETLREWITTHDAVLEPGNGQVFDSVDALFASMGVTGT